MYTPVSRLDRRDEGLHSEDGDLEAKIDAFVDHYNHRRYHESLCNLIPADVYFGRAQTILLERERIKRDTIRNRRLQHQKNAA
jgi:putative transposase